MRIVDEEIDLHECSPGELEWKLLPFLDRGYAEGWERVHIIHGKGKGVLKRMVWEILEELEYIESYKHGSVFEGGRGMTVADYRREPS